MEESKRNPEIRVHPHTRQQLKVMAAQRNMTMQDVVAQLVEQEREREQKEDTSNVDKSI